MEVFQLENAPRDLFGLEKEQKILGSGVREIFTPHTPIKSVNLFFGREEQVKSIIQALLTPGQHVVLYGDRGVGKSSLANIVTKTLLESLIGRCHSFRCDSNTDFVQVFYYVLSNMGYAPSPTEHTAGRTQGGNALG